MDRQKGELVTTLHSCRWGRKELSIMCVCVCIFHFKTLRILFQMWSIIQDSEIVYVKESHSNTLKYIKMQKNQIVSSCFSSQIQQKVLCIYNDVMLPLECQGYQTRLDKANFKNTILIKLDPWCGSLIMFWPCSWLFNTERYF